MRNKTSMVFGWALSLGLACGFAGEAKDAAATPVDKAAISARADDNCEKAKADCPKGSKDCPKGSQCAKAHAKGSHAAADCPKEKCLKHKAGETKAAPPKSDGSEAKPVAPLKEG